MDVAIGIVLFFVYAAVITLQIIFLVKIWKACTAVTDMQAQLKNIAFRDTARYLSEVRRGVISDEDQEEARKLFS